jgi:hypothetical protein
MFSPGCQVLNKKYTKLHTFITKNQHTDRKLLYFVNKSSSELSKSAKSDFLSQYLLSRNIGIIFCQEYQFRNTFF